MPTKLRNTVKVGLFLLKFENLDDVSGYEEALQTDAVARATRYPHVSITLKSRFYRSGVITRHRRLYVNVQRR
jgi:hypothetical protein